MVTREIWILVALFAVFQHANAGGDMTLHSCMNTFVYMSCPLNEKLEIKEIKLSDDIGSVCSNSYGRAVNVPIKYQHLCPSVQDCLFTETVCVDKSECVFFVGDESYVARSGVRQVAIRYGCKAGTARIAGCAAIVLVAIALAIVMGITVFLICKAHRTDTGAYVEFENRLSRTPSMTSDINGRSEKAEKGHVNVVVSVKDEKVAPKYLDEKTASVI